MIGELALIFAMPVAIYSFAASLFGAKNRSVHFVTILVALASVMLTFAFVTDRFDIDYVYQYSNVGLPLVYKLAGIWAGLEGSLLFWALLLAICASIVSKAKPPAIVNAVLQAIVIFFLVMIVFQADPFTLSGAHPADGHGLNPLLQNFYMLIHPPAIYLGYVIFAVPFAYVVAGLVSGEMDFTKIRNWTIVAWLLLTFGNLLGAMWAYVELGWGGFWAWDPVENAGILPWFTACAFLHSVIIHESRKMLKLWNVVLVILSFWLTIFGTFITRSGIIQSVHSFSDMTIGLYFIVFLSIVTIFSVAMLIWKRDLFKGQKVLKNIFSREGAFYINNFLFVLALVGILCGTLLPLFAEWFMGHKAEVGAPFFNRIMAPVGIALLFLTGIGPQMSWVKIRAGLFRKEFLLPLALAAAAACVAYLYGIRLWFPLCVAAGAIFVLATIAAEFIRSARIEKSFYELFRMAPKRFGGLIVHLGIVLLFIGIAGSAYKTEYTLKMVKGEKNAIEGYEFIYNSADWKDKIDAEGVATDVTLLKDRRAIATLNPALYMYKNQPRPFGQIDLHVGLLKDVYLALENVADDGSAEFELTMNPLISFVWLGGIVMLLGTVVAIFPAKTKEDIEVVLDERLGRAPKEEIA